jgi:hypothetical protein
MKFAVAFAVTDKTPLLWYHVCITEWFPDGSRRRCLSSRPTVMSPGVTTVPSLDLRFPRDFTTAPDGSMASMSLLNVSCARSTSCVQRVAAQECVIVAEAEDPVTTWLEIERAAVAIVAGSGVWMEIVLPGVCAR